MYVLKQNNCNRLLHLGTIQTVVPKHYAEPLGFLDQLVPWRNTPSATGNWGQNKKESTGFKKQTKAATTIVLIATIT